MEKIIKGRNFEWNGRWSAGKSLFKIVDAGRDLFEQAARDCDLRYYQVIFNYQATSRYRFLCVIIRNRDYKKFAKAAKQVYDISKILQLKDYRAMWKEFRIGNVPQPERYWEPEYIDDVKR